MNNKLYSQEAVLSRCIVDNYALQEALFQLTPDHFSDTGLQIIFKTLKELKKQGKQIDVVVLAEKLINDKVFNSIGGIKFLEKLVDSSASSSNIQAYIDNLKEAKLKKDYSKILIQTNQELTQGNLLSKTIENLEANLLTLGYAHSGTKFLNAKQLTSHILKQIIKRRENKQEITGVVSGYRYLDKITKGFQNGEYVILAARPSMGKTAYALNMFVNALEQNNKPIAFFSLEMPKTQIMERILAIKSKITIDKIRTPQDLTTGEYHRLQVANEELLKTKMYINDDSGLTINEIVLAARRLYMETKLQLGAIFVDYMGLIHPGKKFNSTVQEVTYISQQLKTLARRLNIPVICLSQLNRSVEQRPNKRPMLSDLRDSGAIEQDADIVIFIYRDDYYKIKTIEDYIPTNIAEIEISKNRNGPLGKFKLIFDTTTNKFIPLTKDKYENI